jgi:hypothetical protein
MPEKQGILAAKSAKSAKGEQILHKALFASFALLAADRFSRQLTIALN